MAASDLIYLPEWTRKDPAPAKELAGDIVKFLATQDYVSGIFVNDRLGKFPGALSMSDVGLMGAAGRRNPPSMSISAASRAAAPNQLQCTVGVHGHAAGDTARATMAASAARETRNFMAAIGPGFQKRLCRSGAGFQCRYRADPGAHVMGLDLPAKGKLKGRVIGEALRGGPSRA